MRTPAVASPGAELAPRARTLPRRYRTALLAAGLLGAVLALPFVVAGGLGLLPDGRVVPGVSVAGVDIGLLTATEATERLRVELPNLASGQLVVTLDGTTLAVPYASIGRDHDYAALLAAALAVGRSGDPLADGWARLRSVLLGTRLDDAITVDQHAFDRLVVQLATRAFARPVDAAVVINPDGTYAVTAPVAGRQLHPDAIRSAWEAALLVARAGDSGVDLASQPVPFTVSQRMAAEAAAAARRMAESPLSITDGANSYPLSPEAIAAAVSFGKDADGAYGVLLNPNQLGSGLADVASAIHREPQDASFTFGANGPTGVTPAVSGRDLAVRETVDAITAALQRRGAGHAVPAVALSATAVEPTLTTAAAQEILPKLVRLSTWTTYYVPQEGNGYGANIAIPANDINGFVILPGEDFSFWRDIGPVTLEHGYRYGGAIIDGRSVRDGALAGGICSTSTTLFNTAARAGLQIDERWNHYYYIDRYPMGLDATVFATDHWAQNMRFTNDTDGPLIIRSYTPRGAVRFDLWGLPLNRVVTFSTPVITNRTYARDTIQYTSSLPAGTSRRVEYPHNGFDVTVTRTVRDGATGEVIWSNTYFSSYRTVNGVTLVGTG